MQGLKRALKLRDLILLNIVAVYTPGTISQAMPLGSLGIIAWTLGILLFMIPYAKAIAVLTVQYPKEGGVYAWTRMAFGEFHGFVCGWCYWVNTFLYVPSIFLSIVAVTALLGGTRTEWINANPFAVTMIATGTLWLSALVHVVGLGQGKWIQNLGAFSRLAIAALILGATIWKLATDGIPSELPGTQSSLSGWQIVALLPFVLNALSGLDLGSVMSEETDAGGKEIPRALLVGGITVAACFLLTYTATLFIGVNDPNPIFGHLQAVNSVFHQAAVPSLAALIVGIELVGLLGSGAAWLAGPARVPFAIGIDHYLPEAFARVHPKFGTPYVAILVQAGVATLLILANTFGSTLQEAYLALLGGSIFMIMVPYFYLLLAWRKLCPKLAFMDRALCFVGLGTVSFGTLACFVPCPSIRDVWAFEIKLIVTLVALLLVGLFLYLLGRNTLNKSDKRLLSIANG